MSNYHIQTPPSLIFPSREKLEETVGIINKAISSLEVYQFHPCDPGNDAQGNKKKRTTKACKPCHRKHQKCHGEAGQSTCIKINCICQFHNFTQEQESATLPSDLPYREDTPTTIGIRRPGLLFSRHFAGETSFCPYIPKQNQPDPLVEEVPLSVPQSCPSAPPLSAFDQEYLIEVYYDNISPYFPLLNRSFLYSQLKLCMENKACYLSPLFFFALFARAAHIIGDHNTEDGRVFREVGDQLMEYALFLRSFYQTQSSISTVLALVIMANHLEQTKCYSAITRSWILAGEAFRMVVDCGIHRMSNLKEFDERGQLCIRSFWLAYITDATISLSYGRPSAVEEKILDVVAPRILATDENIIRDWVQALTDILTLSKISVRIVRYNYSPPPTFQMEGPIKRHNAFLASMDSWLTDIRYPLTEQEKEGTQVLDVIKDRLKFQKELFFLTDLILLHRPYIGDIVNDKSKPSLDICSNAATAIIYYSYKLGEAGLLYHSILPMLAYSLVIALRIQIMNAASSNAFKYNSNKVCELGLEILSRLPQAQADETILSDALKDLRDHYYNRRAPAVFENESNYLSQRYPMQYKSPDQVIFGGSSSSSTTLDPGPSAGGKNNNSLKVLNFDPARKVQKQKRKPGDKRKKQSKTLKTTDSRRGSPSQQQVYSAHNIHGSHNSTPPAENISADVSPLSSHNYPPRNQENYFDVLYGQLQFDAPIHNEGYQELDNIPSLPIQVGGQNNLEMENITYNLQHVSMGPDSHMHETVIVSSDPSAPFNEWLGEVYPTFGDFFKDEQLAYYEFIQPHHGV